MILAEPRPKNCCPFTLVSYWMKACSTPISFQLISFHLLQDVKKVSLSQTRGPMPYFHQSPKQQGERRVQVLDIVSATRYS